MIRPISLKEVKIVTGGDLTGANPTFNSVSIDTRTLREGDLFVAISGPNFNGNDFVCSASRKNAVAAVVNTNVEAENLPLLKVEDTRIALGKMGLMNRQESKACVIAVTGSQGKTTVKEMVTAILANCGEVICTKGNLNNDYGVPLSLLQINEHHEFAVIELGASAPGEIAYSVALTKPKLAHITNVAATHLDGFKNIEGVARAKAELWEGVESNGTAVINIDDAFGAQWCQQAKITKIKRIVKISASGKTDSHYYIKSKAANEDLSSDFVLNTPSGLVEIHLNLAGAHNVANALAAAALSMEAGASKENIKKGLEKIMPVKGRMCGGIGIRKTLIIDDSYNASPASFKAAIDVLSALPGEKIIAMGDMGELGSEPEQGHKQVGLYAKEKKIDKLYGKGALSRFACEAFGKNAEWCSDLANMNERLTGLLGENVAILVKGSRSAGMDKLVQQLLGKEGE